MADEPPPPIVIADPALLALPPLADGEVVRDSGDRACVKPEAPCPVMFGAMHKLLGHKDVRGRGSTCRRLGAGDVELEFGAEGLCLLPPGGTALRLRNLGDAPAQALAAMAEYERDPGARPRVARRGAVDTSHLDLVGGFQDNGGPMLERPDGVVARFKNRGSSTEA
ncbi:quercetin 2,3-dioxygenase [Aureococcus anophagefferens]|nr:quercetin 2,3-dioxygenase [Aureococcus anophagefferens]